MNWNLIQFCRYEDREVSEMLFKSDSSNESETSFVMTTPELIKLEKERKKHEKTMAIKRDGIDREIEILEESNLSSGQKEIMISRRQEELIRMEERFQHLDDVMSNKQIKTAINHHYTVRDDVDQYKYSINGHGVSPWMRNDKQDWYRTQTTQVEGIDHPVLRFFHTGDFAKFIKLQALVFISEVKHDLFRDDPEISDKELIEKFQDFLNVQIGNQ